MADEAAGSVGTTIRRGLLDGMKKGWRAFLWMMKIILPVSLLTTLLQWSGLLSSLDFILRPVMSVMGLPSLAAFPLLIGMLTGIYGAIAAMIVLPFTETQMTLMAIFLLMAHNLIQEGIIQAQSGIRPLKATLFRIVMAVVTVMLVSLMIQNGAAPAGPAALPAAAPLTIFETMKEWGVTTAYLVVKVFFIIMTILTFLEVLKAMGWIAYVVRIFSPLLSLMGLDRKVGILWMTAIVFGLSYGGAVIVEEARNGHLTKEELEMLQLSIGINHSMVEDPMLFVAIGLSAFWLYVPRLVMAIASVRIVRLWYRYSMRIPA
jgi:spore maturation protein SpmB